MDSPIKTPEQLLQYRSLAQIIADRRGIVQSVDPGDTVYAAVERMASANLGFLVVLDHGSLVGAVSERDYARKVILQSRSSKDTPVRDIMTRDVVTVTLDHTLPQCMALMHDKGFRHLPVLEHGRVIAILSIRDILREIVAHHERVIRDLELERFTMLSGGSAY